MTELKRLRLSRNLTQDELARELGVSRTAVAMWETTDQFPTVQTLVMIADIFDVSLDAIVGRNWQRHSNAQTCAS